MLRMVVRLEVWEWVDESELRRDDVADDLRRLFACRWKRAAMRGGGAKVWPSPASSESSMSGSSGISSLPSSSCELTSSISESLNDMAINVQSFPLIKEPRERVELVWGAGDAGVDGDMKQSTSSAMTVALCYGPRRKQSRSVNGAAEAAAHAAEICIQQSGRSANSESAVRKVGSPSCEIDKRWGAAAGAAAVLVARFQRSVVNGRRAVVK